MPTRSPCGMSFRARSCQIRGSPSGALEPYQGDRFMTRCSRRNIQRVKRVPVFLKYLVGTRHFTKTARMPNDLKLLAPWSLLAIRAMRQSLPLWNCRPEGCPRGMHSGGHDAPPPLLHGPQLPDAFPDDRRR